MHLGTTFIDTSVDTLIIAPGSYHVDLLKKISEMDSLWDFDLMTRDEFIQNHRFFPLPHAKASVYEHFDLMPHIVDTIFRLIPYADQVTHMDAPFKEVITHLLNQGLIKKKPWANVPLKSQILITGYPYLTALETTVLDTIYLNHTVIHIEPEVSKEPVLLHHFTLAYDEVVGLAEKISEALYKKTLQKEQIKVHIPDASYETLIRLIFPRFNLPFTLTRDVSLSSLFITREITEILFKSKSYDTALKAIYERLQKLSHNPAKTALAYAFSEILEPYRNSPLSLKKLTPILFHEFKQKTVSLTPNTNTITVTNLLHTPVQEEDALFICGVNEGDIPAKVSTSSIIEDSMASKIGLETTAEASLQKTIEARRLLENPAVKYVSYADKSFTQEKIPSALIDGYIKSARLIIAPPEINDVSYSYQHDLLKAGKKIESALIYGKLDPSIASLIKTLKSHHHPYPKPFKHKDAVLSKPLTDALLKNTSHTSYSRLDDFFKCEFRFLLKNLLRVKEESDNELSILIGNLFHEALSQMTTLPADATLRHDQYREWVVDFERKGSKKLTVEDHFYVENLFDTLDQFIDHVASFDEASQYHVFDLERPYEVPINGEKITHLKGIVDKIMMHEDRFAIIDYKSSPRDLNLVKLEKGLNSQLPFYLNVVKKHTPGLTRPAGLFYHPFTMKVYDNDLKKDLTTQQKNDWKMTGYIDKEVALQLDPNHVQDGFIKSLGVKADGSFTKRSPILSEEELTLIGDYTEALVEKAVLTIEAGRFKINPKGDKLSTSDSCTYCQFKDICYHTHEDLEDFEFDTPEAFLAHLRGGLHDSN